MKLIGFHAAWEAYYVKSMISTRKMGYTDHYGEKDTKCWVFRHVEPPGLSIDYTAFHWFSRSDRRPAVPLWRIGERLSTRGLDLLIYGAKSAGNYDYDTYSFSRDEGEWCGNLNYPQIFQLLKGLAANTYKGTLQWPPSRAKPGGGTYSSSGLMSKEDYLDRAMNYYQTGPALVHKAEIWRLTRSKYLGAAQHEGRLHTSAGSHYEFDAAWTRYCLAWGVPVASNWRLARLDRWNDQKGATIGGDFPRLNIPWRDLAAMVMEIAPVPGSIPSGHEVGGKGTPFAKRPLLDWPTARFGVLKPHNAGLSTEPEGGDTQAFYDAVFAARKKAYDASGRGKFDRIAVAVVNLLTSICGSFAGGAMSAVVNLTYTAATIFLKMLQGYSATGEIDTAALRALTTMALQVTGSELNIDLGTAVELFDSHLGEVKDILKWDYLHDLYGETVDMVEQGADKEAIAQALAKLYDG